MPYPANCSCCDVSHVPESLPFYLQPVLATAAGVLGQSMAAAFFGEAGLTEHELALVSDAVQQVLEEHEASPAPSKLSAAAAQHMEVIQLPVQQQASPRAQSLPVAALQHSPQHQQVYRSAGARSGTGADPAVQQGAPAGNARHSRLSAIMAAEKVSQSTSL